MEGGTGPPRSCDRSRTRLCVKASICSVCLCLQPKKKVTLYLLYSVATAVIGSLQFGYNTGVINAPEQVRLSLSPSVCVSGGVCVCVCGCVCRRLWVWVCAGPREEMTALCPPLQLFLENRNLQMINLTAVNSNCNSKIQE